MILSQIFVRISSFKEAILHRCPQKATHWSAFWLGFSLLIICLVCCSCGSTKVVPQPIREVSQDTIYLSNVQYDSIYVLQDKYTDRSKDTLFIKETNIEYRYKLLRDTVHILKHDSIPYEVRISEIKEVNHIPPWCRWLSSIGGIAVLLLTIALYRKFKSIM